MGLDEHACSACAPEGRKLAQRDSWIEPSLPQALKTRRAKRTMSATERAARWRTPRPKVATGATSTRAIELLPLSSDPQSDEAQASVCDEAA